MTSTRLEDGGIHMSTLNAPQINHDGHQNQSRQWTQDGDSRQDVHHEPMESTIGLSPIETDPKADEDVFAHGFTLFTVVLSLVLSLFLASLDMVRIQSDKLPPIVMLIPL